MSFLLVQLGQTELPTAVFASFAINYFLLSIGSRFLLLQVLHGIYRRNAPVHRVLIYGAGRTGLQLAAALQKHPHMRPVGFIDDNVMLPGCRFDGLPVYSTVGLQQTVSKMNVSRAILAVPSLSSTNRKQITRQLENLDLQVYALPCYAQLMGDEIAISQLSPRRISQLIGRKVHTEADFSVTHDYKARSVLISGAGGSIGSELCRQILEMRPRKIVLFELSELALYSIHQELNDLSSDQTIRIVPVLGSVADKRLVDQVMHAHQIDVIVHAAAYKHVPLVESNPIQGLANNVFGTHVLANAASDYDIERFVLISSDKAVRPVNVMGASKRLSELIVQDQAERAGRTLFSIVRFGNVLGSSGSVVPLFEDQISKGGPVTVTHPEITRFFMSVEEAVRLVLKAGSLTCGGDVFVLDMGKPVRVIDLARQMIKAAGYRVKDVNTPDGEIEIKITGLRPGDKLHEELMINQGDLVTAHDKIFRVREGQLSQIEVARILKSLNEAVLHNDADEARLILAEWIYDFDSQAETAAQ
ncbi:nucleoside-diphosphate sugar epimerase/dehydratase [Pseudaestuariivita rosea]|uniref:polysaccharide biosynthesis protein n=1 Tax=Pseudaestuariivita rosea TaxID=2763263 RepID=UPI001ABA806E|nr:nucleoside-diphosphate sugar epimerase/dehydratase [Pseudaestuariivita rosea]